MNKKLRLQLKLLVSIILLSTTKSYAQMPDSTIQAYNYNYLTELINECIYHYCNEKAILVYKKRKYKPQKIRKDIRIIKATGEIFNKLENCQNPNPKVITEEYKEKGIKCVFHQDSISFDIYFLDEGGYYNFKIHRRKIKNINYLNLMIEEKKGIGYICCNDPTGEECVNDMNYNIFDYFYLRDYLSPFFFQKINIGCQFKQVFIPLSCF